MPQISMKRTKQTKEYATYQEVDTRYGKHLIGTMTLRGWTYPTPPFPEGLRIHLSTEEVGADGVRRDAPPKLAFPTPELDEPAKD